MEGRDVGQNCEKVPLKDNKSKLGLIWLSGFSREQKSYKYINRGCSLNDCFVRYIRLTIIKLKIISDGYDTICRSLF